MKPYIKDLQTGNIRPYGSNHHDSLMISQDGTYLTYEHLQCGDGSIAGDKKHSGFVFCDDEGHTPEEDETLCRYGADAYFNIGGWENPIDVLDKIRAEILEEKDCAYADFERYKVEYLGQDWEEAYDSPPQDDYRYGMERCIDIINKYKVESEVNCSADSD